MTSSPLHTVPRERLLALVDAYAFKAYRHYRTCTRKQQAAVLAAEIDEALAAEPFGQWVTRDGEEAAVVARPLPWDSQFFGVPMGRLDVMLASPEATAEHLEAALAATMAAARAAGVRHLAARVDVADLRTMGVLEGAGFRTMDALVTYIMRPGKDPHPEVRPVGTIRDATPEDTAAIVAITAEAYRGYRGRFHLDPHLSSERADALYLEWARGCAERRLADTVIVAEDSGGAISGYLAYRRREPVSRLAMPLFGGGLGAVRRDSPGAYTGLIQEGSQRAHAAGAVSECQTQNYNFAVIRIYEVAGFHYVRAEYTLHAWLG
ncbi:MAG: N-acetyltransferase family protein [Vicinamibacterales bacterium]